jgi:hypothetical protein
MTDRISAQELLDGYPVLFDTNTRLAHEALLSWAAENEPDRWPSPAAIVRFARCYGVNLAELAGLVGVLVSRVGNRTVFSDSRRCPELVNRLNSSQWSRRALAAYGFYVTAATMTERDQAITH